jgi:membrane protease YdiL (CAAX protease family)
MDKKISNRIFILLIAVYALVTFISVFLPQTSPNVSVPTNQLPAPLPVVALVSAGIALVLYGGLGFIGLVLSRKLGLPEIWDSDISNRQRFLIPALVGLGVGIVIIIGDLVFSPINGIGHFPHPPFPASIVASIAAGIGEEVMFRLFFISFWTWLVSKIILRGRWQTQVYWVISLVSAIAFGLGHLPGVMFLKGWTSMAQVPPILMVEMILLNGILSLFAAYYFKKYGFLAPVGIHFWADMVWHVIWGLF